MSVVAPSGETRVNTTTDLDQNDPSVTHLADGGWLVTWTSEDGQDEQGSVYSVYQQRYAASGIAIGGETLVNTYTDDDQYDPSVTALADGGWVVTWESYEQDGDSSGIYQQRYKANGTKDGDERRVNTSTASSQFENSVTALKYGGWLVTWTSFNQDSSSQDVYQQRYMADGTTGDYKETLVNTIPAGSQSSSKVAALANGGWVVTWSSMDQGEKNIDIFQRQYDAEGIAKDPEVRVNTFENNYQSYGSVTSLADGGWVVTWESFTQDGSRYGIYQQRYAKGGAKVDGETRVNTFTTNNQVGASVTGLKDGGWVVTWTSEDDQDGSADGIYQQRYSAAGKQVGGETRVNTFTENSQQLSSVTSLADGGWLVTWQSLGQYGPSSGIYQQRFTAEGQKVGPTTPTGLSLAQSVSEGAKISDAIGPLTVKAFDTSKGYTFTLLDDADGRFSLSSNGTLTVKDGIRLDYEQAKSHQIKVEVADMLGVSYQSAVTVNVADVKSESLVGSTASDMLKGGRYKDTFDGGSGDDKLWGELGNDSLKGNSGKDTFVFDTKASKSTNRDKIVDFKVKDDSFWLDNAVFGKLGKKGTQDKPAQLSKAFFAIGDKAKDKNDYIAYDKKKGVLSYDADGSGSKYKPVEFATLSKNLKMTHKDFFVI
jgi:Ca2+-binding RTX toxin-like protein